jgi:hypothetical protein
MSNIVDLKLDPDTWDLDISNQDIQYVYDTDAIQQHLRQRLSFFKGEYPYDLSVGVPYHQEFFKKNFNPIIIDSSLKTTIIDTPGVIELTSFILDLNEATRVLDLNFKVIAKNGEVIDYSGTIPI